MDHLTVVDHPLVQHKLTLMRRTETSTAEFRRLLLSGPHLLELVAGLGDLRVAGGDRPAGGRAVGRGSC